MNNNFVKAMKVVEIASGGMKAVELNGREIVICNCGGSFYAVDRRCGHMNAPLEMGTLEDTILTCPMHCARFDVTTGEVLLDFVPPYLGNEIPPPRTKAFLGHVGMLMQHIHTEPIGTYATKVEADGVWVALQRDS